MFTTFFHVEREVQFPDGNFVTPTFDSLVELGKKNNVDVIIQEGPVLLSAFKNALKDGDTTAVIFIGHSFVIRGIDRDGNAINEKSLEFFDGRLVTNLDENPEVNAKNVCALGCESQGVASLFNTTTFIGVDSGPLSPLPEGGSGPVTTILSLTRAGFNLAKAFIENKSPDDAVRLANRVFSPGRQTVTVGGQTRGVVRNPVDIGDKVIRRP
jgi:hypothetical protein